MDRPGSRMVLNHEWPNSHSETPHYPANLSAPVGSRVHPSLAEAGIRTRRVGRMVGERPLLEEACHHATSPGTGRPQAIRTQGSATVPSLVGERLRPQPPGSIVPLMVIGGAVLSEPLGLPGAADTRRWKTAAT